MHNIIDVSVLLWFTSNKFYRYYWLFILCYGIGDRLRMHHIIANKFFRYWLFILCDWIGDRLRLHHIANEFFRY